MTGDQDVAGDDGYDDRRDYESEGGADDLYNAENDVGPYREDEWGGAVIFGILWIACVAAIIKKSSP